MAVFFLLIAVSISFVVVRIGAAALELTGLSWEKAKFQALSAFTNSGFTTSESEAITASPIRRRIVTILIVLGNAGLVAVVGGFAGSVMQPQPFRFFLNIGIMFAGLAALLWIARRPRFTEGLRNSARAWLQKRYTLSEHAPEDLLHLGRGCRLTSFKIDSDSPVISHTLSELSLRQNTVQVLVIERGAQSILVPGGKDTIRAGDELVVFGKTESIIKLFGPTSSAHLLIATSDALPTPTEVRND